MKETRPGPIRADDFRDYLDNQKAAAQHQPGDLVTIKLTGASGIVIKQLEDDPDNKLLVRLTDHTLRQFFPCEVARRQAK